MALPIGPPIEPMLSKLKTEIPRGEGWLYEPKWDGFRAIVFVDGDDVHIASRDKRPLARYFPELPPMFTRCLDRLCVLDGEIVISKEGILDFGALLQRIHPAASRVRMLSETTPASFVAFDLLAIDDRDLQQTPLVERRALLEGLLGRGRDESLTLTPQSSDPDKAEEWFHTLEKKGLDGVIAKREDQLYCPGQRTMIKIKHLRTIDCVVGGYRLSKTGDGVGSLLLGLYDSSKVLQYVGHTSAFKAAERRELLERLHALEGKESFGGGRTPGGPSRWSGGKDVNWVPVAPELVCEVNYEKMQGDRFRHAARFLRWRPDKPPAECTTAQVAFPS